MLTRCRLAVTFLKHIHVIRHVIVSISFGQKQSIIHHLRSGGGFFRSLDKLDVSIVLRFGFPRCTLICKGVGKIRGKCVLYIFALHVIQVDKYDRLAHGLDLPRPNCLIKEEGHLIFQSRVVSLPHLTSTCYTNTQNHPVSHTRLSVEYRERVKRSK